MQIQSRPHAGMQGVFFYAKIEMELGEYAGDYGFLLPNPVSIQSRISTIKVLDSVMYAETSKKLKILGILCYGI
jgi:hypothetical protein